MADKVHPLVRWVHSRCVVPVGTENPGPLLLICSTATRLCGSKSAAACTFHHSCVCSFSHSTGLDLMQCQTATCPATRCIPPQAGLRCPPQLSLSWRPQLAAIAEALIGPTCMQICCPSQLCL